MLVKWSIYCTYVYCLQGEYFEKKSVLSGFLTVSMLIPKLHPLVMVEHKYSCFKSLHNFPNVSSVEAENCFVSVWVWVGPMSVGVWVRGREGGREGGRQK